MKKFLSLALALVLTLALTAPAFAAETKSGTVKEVGVMLDGNALAFPAGAKPEIRGGKTMAPVKVIIEALGGKAAVQANGDIVCTFPEERPYSHTKELRFAGLGKSGYFKGGYTFVALGELAGPLGLDLFWDREAQSAVLVDRYGVIAEIDKEFAILNAAMAKLQNDPDKNYKTSATYDITLDMAATDMSEAMKLAVKIKLDMISSANAVELSGSVDLSALAEVIEKSGTLAWEDGFTQEELAAIKAVLGNVTFQLRFDLETMTYYINMPVLGMLSDGAIPAKSWLKLDMKDLLDMAGMTGSLSDMMALAKEEVTPTVGGMLYVFARSTVERFSSGASGLYDASLEMGRLLAAFLGDGAADKNGSVSTFHFGKAELDQLAGEKIADETFEIFAIDLTVNGGTMTLSYNVKSRVSDGEVISLNGKMTMSADKALLDMTLGMGSLGKIKYVLNVAMKPTDAKPQTLPPTGAQVLDVMELLGGLEPPRPQAEAERMAALPQDILSHKAMGAA